MQVSTYIRKTLYMVLSIYLLVQRRVKSKDQHVFIQIY